jgi:hypothetical protein
MDIKLSFRNEGAAQKMLADLRTGAPAAVALACNKLADTVQAEVRRSLSGSFTLRRQLFVERTIYRNKGTDFARWNQRPIQAVVRVNPERNFLAQHEEGGTKTAASGTNVAIPLQGVRPTATEVVPKRMRPAQLRTNTQVRKVVTPNGTFLVRNRPGTGKGKTLGWRTEFLYKLKRSVPLRPRLGMVDTFSRVVDRGAITEMMAALEVAIAQSVR